LADRGGRVSETLFFRLLTHDDKAEALLEATAAVREDQPKPADTYRVAATSLLLIPGAPFAYWASEAVRKKFCELPAFESNGREARLGDHPSDDFRFLRLYWEVPTFHLNLNWFPYQKGGDYSPYYYDVHLVVDWDISRQTYRGFYGRIGRSSQRPSNYQYFFRPGLTWPRRSQKGLSIRVLPEGCVFADKGPTAFAPSQQLLPLLALVNSSIFLYLVSLQMAFGSYEVGVIQRTPVPDLSGADGQRLRALALACLDLRRDLDRADETTHIFGLPALLRVRGETLAERGAEWGLHVQHVSEALSACASETDEIAFRLYGISDADRAAMAYAPTLVPLAEGNLDAEDEDGGGPAAPPATGDPAALVAALLSCALGCRLGRWDARIGRDPSLTPNLSSAFDALPVCSPGMLVNPDALPAAPGQIVSEEWLRARANATTLPPAGSVSLPTISDPDYPMKIAWDGILVDDPDHPRDIVAGVRSVLELLWGEQSDAIEHEAGAALGVKNLAEYFRNPRGFWEDHVKRYSKSRRKAPIYWLLQSSKRSYAIWLYYHRLDSDLLFKALNNYVDPKIEIEQGRLRDLRLPEAQDRTSGSKARQAERAIERQEALLQELEDFRDKLRKVTSLGLKPDLDDGVVLNAAPLWELMPWKVAKDYWQELLKGEYAWSSIGKQLRAKKLVAAP
jgi:hypothetical protein